MGIRMRLTALTAWSALAVFSAHYLAYRFAYGDPHARAHALAASGHGWVSSLLPLLVMMAVVSLVATALTARVASRKFSASFGSFACFAAAAGGFLLLELVERFVHHGSLSGLTHHFTSPASFAPIVVGLLLLAFLVPAFRLAVRLVERLASPRRRLPVVPLPVGTLALTHFVPLSPVAPAAPRAPPACLTRV